MSASVLGPPRAVMFFVDEPVGAARWYAEAFGEDMSGVQLEDGFAWFDVGGVEVGFHPADPTKNPIGRSTVVYWSVSSVEEARTALLARGATHHRGPLRIDSGRAICQLVDPFGNMLGLDGPL